MIFPRFQNAMPRRPNTPTFCNGRDTIVYQFNGCSVQVEFMPIKKDLWGLELSSLHWQSLCETVE